MRTIDNLLLDALLLKKNFNRTANTRWKKLIFFDNRLDQGKSVLSDQRAKKWELPDDGYAYANIDSSSYSEN